ncbi:hypothetical protein J1N35_024465 [Gossypium stocksii]|uniref:Uncharacterized protein n=1 Tax=Gossypium stocksii TaxID=47602 RepID=A0A9D3ZWA7_9ROSI|nr:hypothetical protein J1N35_024465 [Gossypium stocksii]
MEVLGSHCGIKLETPKKRVVPLLHFGRELKRAEGFSDGGRQETRKVLKELRILYGSLDLFVAKQALKQSQDTYIHFSSFYARNIIKARDFTAKKHHLFLTVGIGNLSPLMYHISKAGFLPINKMQKAVMLFFFAVNLVSVLIVRQGLNF